MKTRCLLFVVFALCVSSAIFAQKTPTILIKYSTAESACNTSLEAHDWAKAENLCKDALVQSDQLPPQYKRERMLATQNYAFSLFSQSKFRLALTNYTQALDIGKTFLKSDSSDLGYAYFNVGRANQGVASLDGKYIVPAEANYVRAEKVYRAAFGVSNDDNAKKDIKASLRRTLLLLQLIAEMKGETEKASQIEARLKALDSL